MSESYTKNPQNLDGVPDLCQLLYLDEPNVLHNLEYRYKKSKIYTSTTAKVLIAVNPYEKIPNSDSDTTMAAYQAAEINLEGLLTANSLEPHVFTVAHAAYHNMVAKQANQSVIVCGESGSGKTESAKLFMKFLAYTSTVTSAEPTEFMEAQSIGNKVLDANPILESFGNAKTILNNNSSRFGKFTKMLFKTRGDQSASLTGAAIETYLLEKSRVVRQDKGERNYHIFYYLCSQAAFRPELLLGDGNPDNFHYINQSGCTTFDGDSSSDNKDFNILVDAFNTLMIGSEEQEQAFATVAGLLHLGNVNFEECKQGEGCTIGNRDALQKAAQVFQIDEAKLEERLTTRTISVMNKCIVKPLTKLDAESNRDSITKAIYNGLFLWVVKRINDQSISKDSKKDCSWIGTLDVFGFEIFENNSFEQFCINYANERLQAFFNFHVLKAEQDLYKREALIWAHIDLPENQDVIDLVVGRPNGIFSILDSSNLQPQSSDETFTHNLFSENKNHPRLGQVNRSPSKKRRGTRGFARMNGFTVKHYAGTVMYNAKEFLVKNNDSTHPDTCSLFNNSKLPVVSKLFMAGIQAGSSSRRHSMTFSSVSSVFCRQLDSLMKTLKATQPYFVRCIKPNQVKAPRQFDCDYVRPQLRCGGLIEALKIIKCGFPTRCTYERLYGQFGSILSDFSTPSVMTKLNKRDFAEGVIMQCGGALAMEKSEYQLGLTMVFFKPGKQGFFQKLISMHSEDISTEDREAIHHHMVVKRIVRMKGGVRAYLRLNHYRNWLRIAKAASIMNIIGKTMFKSLRRVRMRLNKQFEVEERRKMLSNQKYLDALADQERLKAMEAAEKQWKQKLSFEIEAAKGANLKLKESETSMKNLVASVNEAEENLEQMKAMLAREEAEKAALAEQLSQSRQDTQTFLSEVKDLQNQRQRDQANYSDTLSQLDEEKNKNNTLSNSNDKETAEKNNLLSVLERRIKDLKNQSKTSENFHNEAIAEQGSMGEKLQEECNQLQNEKRKITNKLQEMQDKMEREQNNHNLSETQLQQQFLDCQSQLEESRRFVGKHEKECHALDSQLQSAKLSFQDTLDKKESEMKNQQFVVEQQLNNFESEQAAMQTELERMKERHTSMKGQAEDRETELEDELRALKSSHRDSQEQLTHQFREKDTQYAQASTQLALLQTQYEALRQSSTMQQDETSNQLRRFREEKSNLQSQFDKSLAQAKEAIEEEASKRKALEEGKFQMEEAIQSLKLAEQKLQCDVKRQVEQSKHNMNDSQRKTGSLQQEIAALEQSNDKLSIAVEQAKADSYTKESKLKQKNDQLQSKIDQLNSRFLEQQDSSEATIRKMKKDMKNNKTSSAEEYDASLQAANSQIQNLRNDIFVQNQTIEGMAQELVCTTNGLNTVKNDLDVANQENLLLQRKLQDTENNASSQGKKLADELAEVQQRMAKASAASQEAAAKLIEMQSASDSMQAELRAKISEEQHLKQQSEQELMRLKADLQVTNERLEIYQTSHEENVAQLDFQLEAEKENTRETVAQNSLEMQELQQSVDAKLEKERSRFEAEKKALAANSIVVAASALKKATDKHNSLKSENARLAISHEDMQMRIDSLQEDNHSLKELCETKTAMLKNMDVLFMEQQSSTSKALEDLSSKYNNLATAQQQEQGQLLDMSKKACESSKQELSTIKDTKAAMHAQNLRLEQKNQEMSSTLAAMKVHHDHALEQAEERSKLRVQSVQRKYERRLNHLQTNMDSLMQELSEQENDTASLLALSSAPSFDTASLESDYAAKVDGIIAEQNQVWSQQSADYEAQITKLRQQVLKLSNESRNAGETVETLRTQAKLQQEQLTRHAKFQNMKAEESWENISSNLRAEVRKLQSKNSRMQKELVVKGSHQTGYTSDGMLSPQSLNISSNSLSPRSMINHSIDFKKSPMSRFSASPESLRLSVEAFSPVSNVNAPLSVRSLRSLR